MSKLPLLPLLHAFGNEQVFLEKTSGAGSIAMRLAVGAMEAQASRREILRAQLEAEAAERRNEVIRRIQAAQMYPVSNNARRTRAPVILMAGRSSGGGGSGGLGYQMAPDAPREYMGSDIPLGMDEGMVRMASAIGADLAADFEKDAGITSAIGGALKGLGGAARAAGSNMKGTLGQAFNATKMQVNIGAQQAKDAVKGTLSKAQAKLPTRAPTATTKAAPTYRAPESLPPPSSIPPTQPTGSVPAPAPTPAATAGASAMKNAPPPTPEAAKPGQGFMQRAGLDNEQWKWKLPVLGAGLYGAYKAVGMARKASDVMSNEPAPYTHGSGVKPAYGVNEYGQPDRGTPFTG